MDLIGPGCGEGPPRVVRLVVLRIVPRKHGICSPEFKTKEVVRVVLLVKNGEKS